MVGLIAKILYEINMQWYMILGRRYPGFWEYICEQYRQRLFCHAAYISLGEERLANKSKPNCDQYYYTKEEHNRMEAILQWRQDHAASM